MEHIENYFPIAFLTIMTVNFLAAGGLVAAKRFRSWSQERSQSRSEKLLETLRALEADPNKDLKPFHKVLRKLRQSEIRQVIQKFTKEELRRHRNDIEAVTLVEPRKGELFENLKSRSKWRKIDALIICGALRVEEAFSVLKEEVRNSDVDVVFAAIGGLGEWDDERSISILLELLDSKTHLTPSRIATYVEQAFTDVCPLLLEKAKSEDPVSRYWAVKLMEKCASEKARRILMERIQDADEKVRAAAADTLGTVGNTEVHASLIQALQDPVWYVRSQAARSCGRLKVVEAVPNLIELFRDKEWWVRSEAREALERLGPKASDALMSSLEDKEEFARNMAAEALENMGFIDAMLWELRKGGQDADQALETLAQIRRAGGSESIDEMIQDFDAGSYSSFQALTQRGRRES